MAIKEKLAELIVDINAKLAPLKGSLAKANAMLKRGFAGMRRMARRAAIAIGVALVAALAWATKAAAVQEDAEVSLAAALRKTGDATEKNMRGLKKYAATLQETTKFGDEEIIAQMAYAKNLGVSTAQLKAAAKAAIGLAAKYKLDLRTAMMLVGRASQGQTQMLTRYGIVLDEGLTSQEKFNEVLLIGASAFELAEAAASSTTGKLKQLWNTIGDIAEVIGAPLLKKIGAVAKSVKEWADENQKLVTENVRRWMDAISDALSRLKPLMVFMAKNPRLMLGALLALISAPFLPWIGSMTKGILRGVKAMRGWFIISKAIAAQRQLKGTLPLFPAKAWQTSTSKMVTLLVKARLAMVAFGKASLAVKAGMIGTIGLFIAPLIVLIALLKKFNTIQSIKDIWKNRKELKGGSTFEERERMAAKTANERAIKAKKRQFAIEKKVHAAAAVARADARAAMAKAYAAAKKAQDEARTAVMGTEERNRALADYYDKVGGYEKEKAEAEKFLRYYEAKETAKTTGLDPEQIYGELHDTARRERMEAKLEEAIRLAKKTPDEMAQVGLAGFQSSWNQIATGAKRVDEQSLAVLTKMENELREIKEQGRAGAGMQNTGSKRF